MKIILILLLTLTHQVNSLKDPPTIPGCLTPDTDPLLGCKVCVSHFYKTPLNPIDPSQPNYMKCASCPYGCSLCTDANTCQACYPGRYLTSDFQCPNCKVGCLKCKQKAENCTQCSNRFYLANNTCNLCQIENCRFCSSEKQCSTCSYGYKLLEDKTCDFDSDIVEFKETSLFQNDFSYILIAIFSIACILIWSIIFGFCKLDCLKRKQVSQNKKIERRSTSKKKVHSNANVSIATDDRH